MPRFGVQHNIMITFSSQSLILFWYLDWEIWPTFILEMNNNSKTTVVLFILEMNYDFKTTLVLNWEEKQCCCTSFFSLKE